MDRDGHVRVGSQRVRAGGGVPHAGPTRRSACPVRRPSSGTWSARPVACRPPPGTPREPYGAGEQAPGDIALQEPGITLRPRSSRPNPGRSGPSRQFPCSPSRRAPRRVSCRCLEPDAAPDPCSTPPRLGPPGSGATSGCSSGWELGRTPRSRTTTRMAKASEAAALTAAARCRPWVNASRATSSRAAPTRSGVGRPPPPPRPGCHGPPLPPGRGPRPGPPRPSGRGRRQCRPPPGPRCPARRRTRRWSR